MKEFRTESKRVLDLMINSIYTHKEIFLRELVSNASDAIDKLYYKARTEGLNGYIRDDFAIRITADKSARTLTISDNGCGMTEEEIDSNLGVIAKSGTLEFKQKVNDADISQIGQFGVGFYASFMVAKEVTVLTRSYTCEDAFLWESKGVEGYSITKSTRDTNGTTIILSLKDDEDEENYGELLEEYRLRELIKKYSDYIRYPIIMQVEKTKHDEEDKGETYFEDETINSMVPIWKKNRDEVTEEEYNSFYMDKFHDYSPPLAHAHSSAEGVATFKALLFFPSRAPYDYYTKEYTKGLSLYSNGVMIMEKCEELLPDCFGFVKGLVDSEDLTLNISRETLQHNRQVKVIANNLEKKIKSELLKLLKDKREDYETLWKAFGMQLKYGLYADYGMKKDLLADLLLFHSVEKDKLISLQEYVDSFGAEQKYIYYASGASKEAVKQLPQLELIRSKGYDVLALTDNIDEFAMKVLAKYADKELRSASAELGIEQDEAPKEENNYKEVLDGMKEALRDKVKEVILSKRLVTRAVCLTTEGELSIEMEKVLSSMPNSEKVSASKVLEINKDHIIFKKLNELYVSDRERFNKVANILYGQARLIEGLALDNPAEYGELVLELI